MRDTGYECGRCGYTPTQAELDRGTCPGCAADRRLAGQCDLCERPATGPDVLCDRHRAFVAPSPSASQPRQDAIATQGGPTPAPIQIAPPAASDEAARLREGIETAIKWLDQHDAGYCAGCDNVHHEPCSRCEVVGLALEALRPLTSPKDPT